MTNGLSDDELRESWATDRARQGKDNSPPIYRWVSVRYQVESVRDARNLWLSHVFFRPSGAWGIWGHVNPAINRWAIFGCPYGTNITGGVEK